MIKYVLFDLDGTLTDPAEGITNSVAYALERYGINVSDKTELNCFIGPPLSESFEKYYGFSKEESINAVSIYREYFKDRGIFENKLYSDINEMLKALVAEDKKIILATSKPEIFAIRILDHFNIGNYFTAVSGSLLNGERVDKHDVIEHALKIANINDRSECVMVGDRLHDMIGGNKSSLLTIGVEYGYGSRDELISSGADYTVKTVYELSKLLLSI